MSPTPAQAADALRAARTDGRLLPRFTATHPEVDAAWGSAAQDLDRARRLASGERLVGFKLGLTSRAKQRTMDVHEPIVGFLTDSMCTPGFDVSALTQPRVEPEVAFVLTHDLDRPLTRDEVPDQIASVCLALEVLDSRFERFRFGLADVLADNTSAAGFVLGEQHDLPPDLADLTCTWYVEGREPEAVATAAILGDPLLAVVHLSEHLARRGDRAPAGSILLGGAMTDAVALPTSVRLTHPALGEIASPWTAT